MEDLTKKSPEDLAQHHSQCKEGTRTYILAEKEWLRRERIHQHELDLKLISQQVKWMKIAVIASTISVIIGAILGAWLTNTPIFSQQQTQQ